ncbi:MAG: hypothetical protein EZS28_037822 [Streblomastix strix]|uniref:Uncharacterized protein n=1 Tax=Streblomastix strix TaxID=222440 RepID=A0A5J4U9T2_9EUKA|nr:MAG: hypothetical protein EZS28_037822 [Streblomastix strix]
MSWIAVINEQLLARDGQDRNNERGGSFHPRRNEKRNSEMQANPIEISLSFNFPLKFAILTDITNAPAYPAATSSD